MALFKKPKRLQGVIYDDDITKLKEERRLVVGKSTIGPINEIITEPIEQMILLQQETKTMTKDVAPPHIKPSAESSDRTAFIEEIGGVPNKMELELFNRIKSAPAGG